MIEALRELGSTVLLTTHYMDEAEHLADRIVVISGGKIVARGTADDLAQQVNATTRITWKPATDFPEPPESLGWKRTQTGAMIETDDVVPALSTLTGWALEAGVDLPELNVARPTLEDVYLTLTGGADS